MTLEVVLFDIDGTLIDSNEQHVNAWAFAFRDEGKPQELGDIREQIGKGGDLLIPALLPSVDKSVQERIAGLHGAYFKNLYLDNVRAFTKATDLIEKVHASGRKVVLASSAKGDELDHYVRLLGIERFLAGVASSDDVDASKPEPDIFGKALETVGVPADAAIVIGDTPYDVEAASKAGITAIGLTSGPFDERRLKDAGAIAVFAGVADLFANFDASPLGG